MDPPPNQYENPKRRSSPSSGISIRRRSKANDPGYKYKWIVSILSLTVIVLSLFWVVNTVSLLRFSANNGQQSGITTFNNTKYVSSELTVVDPPIEMGLVIYSYNTRL